MNRKLKLLIKKLNEKYPLYELTTKNFLQPDVKELTIAGQQVLEKTHTTVVQITVFEVVRVESVVPFGGELKSTKEDRAMVMKKVDGIGRGLTQAKAVEAATINAINALGIF